MFAPLPEAIIGGHIGTLNDRGVYGYVPRNLVALPPCPMKKYLTPDD